MAQDRPKAVIVYNTCWYVRRFRIPLLRALASRGFEVHIIAPFDGAEAGLTAEGFVVHDWKIAQHGVNPVSELRSLWRLYGILGQLRPSVVLSYTIKCNVYSGILSRFLPYSFLPSVVGLGRVFEKRNLLTRGVTLLLRQAFRSAARVFFQNREDSDTFRQLAIIRSDQAQVTPGSGVNTKVVLPAPSPAHEQPVVFFIFGRLIPAKGFGLFLDAAKALRTKFGGSVAFWIAGGVDGESRISRELAEQIAVAHREGLVRYWGHTDSILELVSQCSVVVLPSTYNEGVPRSLLEGLASGKAVITTDWKGCRDTVRESPRNGWLVTPGSTQSLIDAMSAYVTLPQEERAALSRSSRQLAEDVFDENNVLELYLSEVSKGCRQ